MKLRGMMQDANREILQATLRDVPEFAFDVLQLFVNEPFEELLFFPVAQTRVPKHSRRVVSTVAREGFHCHINGTQRQNIREITAVASKYLAFGSLHSLKLFLDARWAELDRCPALNTSSCWGFF
jgi:hypothetical protein